MLDLHNKLNLNPINFKKYLKQKNKKKNYTKYNWIGQQHGVLSEKIDVHKKNDLYIQDNHLFIWKGIPRTRPKKLELITKNHIFSLKSNESFGFKHNLCFYYKKYHNSIEHILKNEKKTKKTTLPFLEKFKNFLIKKKEETKQLILTINNLTNSPVSLRS